MSHSNLVSKGPFDFVWSGVSDASLRPTLLVAKDGSGYRPMATSEFGASVSISGATISVGAVSVTGAGGKAIDVQTVSGFNAIPVYIVSGQTAGGTSNSITQVGVTGDDGTSVQVTSVSGFNAFPVFIVSGQTGGTSSSVTKIGLTGTDGTSMNVATVSGYNALPVFIVSGGGSSNVQGTTPSGETGTMPNPVLVGALVKADSSGNYAVGSLQPPQMDTYGNLWVSLGTALRHLIDNVATRPLAPVGHGVYSVLVTGSNFSNYSGVIPTVTGNLVQMSVEPASTNAFQVFYSFSGTAATGDAWELRGDRTFETTSNLNVYFSSFSGSQKVLVHYQTF